MASALTLEIFEGETLVMLTVLSSRAWDGRGVLGVGVELRDTEERRPPGGTRDVVGDADDATDAARETERDVEDGRLGSGGVGSMIVQPNNAVNMAASDGSGRASTSFFSE